VQGSGYVPINFYPCTISDKIATMRAVTASNPAPELPDNDDGDNVVVTTTTAAPVLQYASAGDDVQMIYGNTTLCLIYYYIDNAGYSRYSGIDPFFNKFDIIFAEQADPPYWYITRERGDNGGFNNPLPPVIISTSYDVDGPTVPLQGWSSSEPPDTMSLSQELNCGLTGPPALSTSGGFWNIPSCLTKYKSSLDATEGCNIDDGGKLVYSTRVAAQGDGELWIYTMVIFFAGQWSIIEFPDCLIQGNYTVLSTTTDLNTEYPDAPPNNATWTNTYQITFSTESCS
jgi:hypothetical protein